MAVVLLVEDDDHVRVLVESYLKELGHKVLSAVTRQGAMAVLEDTPNVDLLFTDMELMGDIQAGIELARQAAERWRHLKVLYTTGGGVTEGMRARLVRHSALLEKPYTVDQLRTSLSDHFKISAQPG